MWAALASALIWLAAQCMGGLISRALVALGIGTVTAIGFNALLNGAVSAMTAQFNLNAELMALVQATGLIWFAGTIMSAISTRLIIRGLTSDSMTFWTKRMQLPSS